MTFNQSIRYDRVTGARRSSEWPALRAKLIAAQPWCSVCGGVDNITPHHLKPFHLHPELELDPHNLLVVCEGHPHHLDGVNCHFVFCHFANWKNFNPHAIEDADYLRHRFAAELKERLFPGKLAA